MKKQIFILLAIMVIATGSYAQVTLQSFQIGQNYLEGTSLKVPNINVPTPFKFLVQVMRGINSNGGFVSGNCVIKLYYTENQSSDSNIPDDPTSLLLLTKNITSSDYNSSQAILADLDASLPANKQYGKILVRLEFLDNQNINRVSYSSTRYGIYIVPPAVIPKAPVYLIAGNSNGEYYLSLDDAMSTPFGWSNRGIYYYGYKTQAPGTVPVYEFTGKSYDSSGSPGFPENLTYYSTSAQTPTQVLTGSGSNWSTTSSKVAFYAYNTQVAGTVPIYCYSHESVNLFLFTQNPPGDSWIQKNIAFYAFPVQ
ncbi:hypothetical protein [Pedobacter borealis]|uniref:hypothetical protein n=1 Tax=Pedobacter borealis TaxID=475254 RepID=UPI0012F89E26|nr:hypothetical protein [Pedobacter borealis]